MRLHLRPVHRVAELLVPRNVRIPLAERERAFEARPVRRPFDNLCLCHRDQCDSSQDQGGNEACTGCTFSFGIVSPRAAKPEGPGCSRCPLRMQPARTTRSRPLAATGSPKRMAKYVIGSRSRVRCGQCATAIPVCRFRQEHRRERRQALARNPRL